MELGRRAGFKRNFEKELMMNTASVTPDYTQNFDTLLYRVRPGDSLSKILYRYHTGVNKAQLSLLIQQVQADNPFITDPDRIKPDQLISLKIPQQYCSAPTPGRRLPTIRTESQHWVSELEHTWDKSTREERDLLSTLLPAFIGLGSAKMSMIDTTFSTNAPLLREMAGNYEAYKAGRKSKGQYDYQRRKLVGQLTTNLGPTNLILNGGQKPTEVLRISKTKELFRQHLWSPKQKKCCMLPNSQKLEVLYLLASAWGWLVMKLLVPKVAMTRTRSSWKLGEQQLAESHTV